MQKLPAALGYGALSGALLTAPLIGLMFLADKLLDLPFVPFALFDWIATVTPGPLITFGIDMMIESLLLFNLSVADAAKTSEQVAAVLMVFFMGVAAGAIFFAARRGGRSRDPSPGGIESGWLGRFFAQPIPGLVAGLIFGLPLTAVSLPMGQSTMNPVVTFIVLMILFLAWGLSLEYFRRRLTPLLSAATDEGVEEVRSVSVIDRRQFLIRLGATTATITVASAGLGAALGQDERTRIAESVADSMPPAERPQ